MEKNSYIAAGLLVLVIGFGVGYIARGDQTPSMNNHQMADGRMMGNATMPGDMGGAMDSMMAVLDGKTGDAFDKAFLSEMIMHHQGAVVMAQAALQYANHKEIKDMAQAIITAQTTEIQQMKAWGTTWYTN
jgi:uncharacterized protein (DUF305 family)